MMIFMWILPKALHMLEKSDFFEFKSQHCHFTMFIFLISVKCVIGFQYFGEANQNFSAKKAFCINFFICLELKGIWIRQNDADPTRSQSGSTTLLISVPVYVAFAIHLLNPPL